MGIFMKVVGKSEVYKAGSSVNVSSVTSFMNAHKNRGVLITIQGNVGTFPQMQSISYEVLKE